MDRNELYASVTREIVGQIEAGAGSWRMPWHALAEVGSPVNAATQVAYRGGNHLMLGLVAASRGWSGRWATYKQWQHLGGQVRRGERATYGVKWSPVEDRTTGRTRMVPFCFSVFAVEQVDGWTPPEIPVRSPLERDQIVEAFFTAVGADVRHEGNRAYYSPTKDAIVLPEMDRFDKVADYYATSAHEHAHWTGHSSRLGRDLSGRFGSDSYAMEELCAELSAAFTCAALHLSPTPRPDHAAYLASWLRVLKADHSAIFHVASRAQAATDYLTSASVASVVAA